MESWDQVWRRRGEMFLTLGVSSGILWAATILASTNSSVNIWPPEAVCALLVVLGLYAMIAPDVERLPLPGRQHAAQALRQTPLYRAHVDDIRQFALWASNQLFGTMRGGVRYTLNNPIDFSTPMGKRFRSHFPETGELVDQWNATAEGYQAASNEFTKVTYDEQSRVLPNDASNQLAQLLQAVALGTTQLCDLTWQAQGGQVTAAAPAGTPFWSIAKMPGDVVEADRLLTEIWRALDEIKDNPAVVKWNNKQTRIAELRKPLLDAFELAQVTHDPAGHCDGCPQP